MMCIKCKNKMELISTDKEALYKCPKCGMMGSMLISDPLLSDSNIYTITVDKFSKTKENLIIIRDVFSYNFITINKMLDNSDPFIISLDAKDMLLVRDKLKLNNIAYIINPDFPY